MTSNFHIPPQFIIAANLRMASNPSWRKSCVPALRVADLCQSKATTTHPNLFVGTSLACAKTSAGRPCTSGDC